jgi:uncharacterized protein YjbI with pentapeptide repeats
MTKSGPDGGVDFVAYIKNLPSLKLLIQCKDWSGAKVGVKVVRELYGVVKSSNARKGVLITTSSFTKDAVKFSHTSNIALIDGFLLRDIEGCPKDGSFRALILHGSMCEVKMSGLVLENLDLRGADLYFAEVMGSNLSGADFSHADLTQVDFRRAKLRKANFSNANLERTDFTQADLREAVFDHALFCFTGLENTDLRGADLSKAVFEYGDVKRWNSRDTDLPKIPWNDVFINGAKYNQQTKWPNGFDVCSARVILED